MSATGGSARFNDSTLQRITFRFWCLFFVEKKKLAASPGFAPGPSVSETDALLITPRGNSEQLMVKGDRVELRQREFCFNFKPLTINIFKMVAREGSAPPIAGCRPAVMLFHYRAIMIGNEIGNLLPLNGRCVGKALVNRRLMCFDTSATISANK
jgi:hypothetical protein